MRKTQNTSVIDLNFRIVFIYFHTYVGLERKIKPGESNNKLIFFL